MNAIEDRPAALITGKGIDAIGDGIWLLHGQGQSFVADVGGGLLVVDSGPGGRITAGMIEALRTQTDLPVLAICYSHGHLGYNAGVKQWLDHAAQRGDPRRASWRMPMCWPARSAIGKRSGCRSAWPRSSSATPAAPGRQAGPEPPYGDLHRRHHGRAW
jgi:hypothetical protein